MRLKICTKFIQILIKKEMSQKFDNLQKINRLYKKTFGTNEQLRDPIVHIFSVSWQCSWHCSWQNLDQLF
jgi:hypothetical protein